MTLSGKRNQKKTKKLGIEREKIIESSFTDQIKFSYKTNELAHIMHPDSIDVIVDKKILETKDTITLSLRPVDGELPPFKAGQYLVLDVMLNNHLYKRCYSISSSPKNLATYDITIKKVTNGVISNYLFHEVKEGKRFTIHGPYGEFIYEPLRDQKDVLALVGGSGITPIMSLARAVFDHVEDCTLTILYGIKSEEDIIFKQQLVDFMNKDSRIKVEFLVQKNTSLQERLIKKEDISKYEIGKYSYFVCGPVDFYHSLNDIFKELDIPNKYIRHDIFKESLLELRHIKHTLTVITENKEITIPCYEDESLSKAMEESGVFAPRKCLVGVCGFCKSKLVQGTIKAEDTSIYKADIKHHYIHPCVSYPLSDLVIELCK